MKQEDKQDEAFLSAVGWSCQSSLYPGWQPVLKSSLTEKLALFKVILALTGLLYDLLHMPHLTHAQMSYTRTKWPNHCLRRRTVLSGLLLGKKNSHCSQELIFPLAQKTTNKQTPAHRMRGQIYSQPGSRVVRLDAFLEWSFFSLLLSFFEVSPRLPPLPPAFLPFVYSI